MPNVYTSKEDEDFIRLALGVHGLGDRRLPKWTVLRLALALSLRIPTQPDEQLDKFDSRGGEYDLEQVTWQGQEKDLTDAFSALLSVYHGEDLLNERERFRILLQRHIRRGLREMRHGWRESHDFHEFLYQELFGDSVVGTADTPNLEESLLKSMLEVGIRGEIREQLRGPRLTRFMVYLADVNDLDRLRRGLEKISFSLGLHSQGVFMQLTEKAKIVALDVPRKPETWKSYSGADLRTWVNSAPAHTALAVWPGVDVLGNAFAFDLAQAPHLFVGGTTGSGKSVCLHALLLSLLWKKSPEELKLCLIDPKKLEFAPYKGLPHNLHGEVITETADAVEALNGLTVEMEERESALSDLGARDFSEAESQGRLKFTRVIVVVEELADLLMQSRFAEEPLVRLAQKARAVGIHLILSTQRPDAETFSGLLRSNIPSRIALTVQKASESRIIIDEIGAERLSGKGDMLVKIMGQGVARIHGVHIRPDDIAACVRAAKAGDHDRR